MNCHHNHVIGVTSFGYSTPYVKNNYLKYTNHKDSFVRQKWFDGKHN